MAIKRLAFEPILIRYLRSQGLDPASVTGVSSFQQLDRQRRLYRLAVFAKRATGDELLGLKIGKRAPLSAFGALGHAVLGASTPRQVLQISVKHIGIFQSHPTNAVTLGNRAGRLYLTYWHPIQLRGFPSFVSDLFFSSTLQALRTVGTELDGMQLELAYQPNERDGYLRELGIPIKFGAAQSRLSAPVEMMNVHLPGKFSAYSQAQLRLAETVLAKIKSDDGLQNRIVEILATAGDRIIRASDVANMLNVSERTLRRKLGQDGISFTDLNSRLRVDLAQTYLLEMPVRDVAELLGYHDSSTFRRAFRRWSGKTPAEYRRDSFNTR